MSSASLFAYDGQQATHNMLTRCAARMRLGYLPATEPRSAQQLLTREEGIALAVIAFERGQKLPWALCSLAHQRTIPPVLYGKGFSKLDVLQALRMGVVDILVKPAPESICVVKLLRAVEASGKAADLLAPSQKTHISPLQFGQVKDPPEKAKIVVEKAREVLALPQAVTKVIRICDDAASAAKDLEPPISSDPALCAMLLKRVNSAAFGAQRRIDNVTESVVRIGRREVKNLALAMSVFKLFDQKEKTFGFNRYMYWAHALGVGIAAGLLSRTLKLANPEEAFLVGLLHDLGKIIFDDYLNTEYQRIVKRAATENRRINALEQELFLMDHTHMGARVGEHWNLPANVVQAIESHHKVEAIFSESAGPAGQLARLACAANSVVKAMGVGHSGDFHADEIPAAFWGPLREDPAALDAFCRRFREEFQAFAEMLGLDPRKSFVTFQDQKKEQVVGIPLDGLGLLLQIFFASRGYATVPTDWDLLMDLPEQAWVAGDVRSASEDFAPLLLSGEISGGRQAFLLSDELPAVLPPSVHVVKPACDLFQLEPLTQTPDPAADASPAEPDKT